VSKQLLNIPKGRRHLGYGYKWKGSIENVSYVIRCVCEERICNL